MKEQVLSYFTGERQQALIILVAGLCAAAAAIALVLTRGGYRGMALPLSLVALVEISIGGGVWLRSDRQAAGVLEELGKDPAAMAKQELGRMGPVMRNFQIIKLVEITVIALGIALTYGLRRSDLAYAAGCGCIMQGCLMLLFDLFAERRAEPYVEALRALIP